MGLSIVDWIPVIIVAVVGAVTTHSAYCRRYSHRIFHWKIRDILHSLLPTLSLKDSKDGSLSTATKQELLNLSLGEIVAGLVFILFLVIRYFDQYDKLLVKQRGAGAIAFRALGELNFMTLAFLVLPVTKHSIWLHLMGISYERAIKYHRFWAALTIVIMGVHGFGMWVEFSHQNRFSEVLWMRINPETGWSNLSGLLSFLCGLLMMLLAHSRVRNFAYEWFYHAHLLLAPLVYIFAGLHMPFLLPWMMLALVLYGMDIAVRVWFKYMKTSASIVQLQSIPLSSDPTGTVAVRLGIRVDGRSAAFQPGQFFLVTIPALSYLEAHPFSLCLPSEVSIVDGQASTLLQFAIKPTGQHDSWTQRLVQCAVGDIAYVDGPFGGPVTPHVEDNEHLLLVCGGIGATPCLAILAQLVQVQKTLFPWRSVTLLWSCRGRELFDEFAPLLDQARVLCGPDNVLLFDTSAKTDVEQDAAAVYKAGRPDYMAIVSHCLKSASRGVPSASSVTVTDKNTVVPASTTSSTTLCIEAGETTNGVYHPGTTSISVEDRRTNHALTVFLCGPTAMVAEVQYAITACRRTSVFTDSTVNVRVHEEVFHL